MKKMVFPVVLMILAGLVFASVLSCETDKGPTITTYTGKDTDGKEYKLVVTDGSKYELFIDGVSTGTGTVKTQGETLTLTQNGEGSYDLTVEVSGNFILSIDGQITPDEGGNPLPPIVIQPPYTAVAGVWDWSTSDDSKTNEWKATDNDPKTKQSVFPPGGASKITNAVEADDEGNYKPYEYPAGTVKDKDGNTITVPVYNFTGNTKVIKPNRTATEGAQYPLVGWEAVPDADTLAKLKTAYGYSFWVRLNSATASKWAFLTAVVTDFTPEEGHEYKHWFGNQAGASGGASFANKTINNFTSKLDVGTWYKITVVMDQTGGFNIFQDKWIWQYDSGKDFRGDFNQTAASKIQWQIPLQHNGGSERSGEPYDITDGSYDFNLDFYGLELLIK